MQYLIYLEILVSIRKTLMSNIRESILKDIDEKFDFTLV